MDLAFSSGFPLTLFWFKKIPLSAISFSFLINGPKLLLTRILKYLLKILGDKREELSSNILHSYKCVRICEKCSNLNQSMLKSGDLAQLDLAQLDLAHSIQAQTDSDIQKVEIPEFNNTEGIEASGWRGIPELRLKEPFKLQIDLEFDLELMNMYTLPRNMQKPIQRLRANCPPKVFSVLKSVNGTPEDFCKALYIVTLKLLSHGFFWNQLQFSEGLGISQISFENENDSFMFENLTRIQIWLWRERSVAREEIPLVFEVLASLIQLTL